MRESYRGVREPGLQPMSVCLLGSGQFAVLKGCGWTGTEQGERDRHYPRSVASAFPVPTALAAFGRI